MRSSIFDKDTVAALSEPLAREHVKTRKGVGTQQLSYLPAYHVIAQANRLFGFGAWGTEIIHLQKADVFKYEKPIPNTDRSKPMISVSYTCQLKLTVRGTDGIIQQHEDIGFGNGVAGETAAGIASAIELATKEAVTDALKRCLRYYGEQFGLTLYDKEATAELMSADQIEATRPVTEDDIAKLRNLMSERGIDDDFVMAALKGEAFDEVRKSIYLNFDRLEDMTQEWFAIAYAYVDDYGREEREASEYKDKLARNFQLIKDSVNMNMLKALFIETEGLIRKQKDKEAHAELVKLYHEIEDKLKEKKK